MPTSLEDFISFSEDAVRLPHIVHLIDLVCRAPEDPLTTDVLFRISGFLRSEENAVVLQVYQNLLSGLVPHEQSSTKILAVLKPLWDYHLNYADFPLVSLIHQELLANRVDKISLHFEALILKTMTSQQIKPESVSVANLSTPSALCVLRSYLFKCHHLCHSYLSLNECQLFLGALIGPSGGSAETYPVPEIRLLHRLAQHFGTLFWVEDDTSKYAGYISKALGYTLDASRNGESSLFCFNHIVNSLVELLEKKSKAFIRELLMSDFCNMEIVLFLSSLYIYPSCVRNFNSWKYLILTLSRISYSHVSSTVQVVTATVGMVIALFPLLSRHGVSLERSTDLFKDVLSTLRGIEPLTSLPVSFIAKETMTFMLEERRGPSLFLRQAVGDRSVRLELEQIFELKSFRTLDLNDLNLLRPFRDHPHGGAGWDNTGNTCFVAACVNAIFLTSPLLSILSRAFQKGVSMEEVPGIGLPFPFLNMGDLISRRSWNRDSIIGIRWSTQATMNRGSPTQLGLQLLWSTLKCLTSAHLSDRRSLNLSAVSILCPFGIGSQEDVFEFLQWMLNRFASIELGASPATSTTSLAAPLPSLITTDLSYRYRQGDTQSEVLRLFTTKQTSILVCHQCQRRSLITETLNAILLPIDDHTVSYTPNHHSHVSPRPDPSEAATAVSSHEVLLPVSWPTRVSPPLDSASTTSSCKPNDTYAHTRRRAFILADLSTKPRQRPWPAKQTEAPLTTVEASPLTDDPRPPSVVSSVYDLGSETSSVTTRESSLSEVSTDDQVALSSRGSTNSEQNIADCDETEGERGDDAGSMLTNTHSETGDNDQRNFFAVSTLYKQSAYSTNEPLRLNWFEEAPDGLADLINRYLSYEYLTDYTCDRSEGCGTLGQSGKQAFFERLPPILMLVLNRFRHLGQSAKICAPVMLSKYLAIPIKSVVMNSDLDFDNGPLTYEIYEFYCTIIHSGESLHSGHYTVFGRPVGFMPLSSTPSSDQQLWFLFDDNSVSPTDFSCLQRMTLNQIDTPYVVFFKHIQTERAFPDGTDSPQLLKRRTTKTLHSSDNPAPQLLRQRVLGADTLELLLEKIEGFNGDKGTRASSDDDQDVSMHFLEPQCPRAFIVSPSRSEDAGPSLSSSMSGTDRPPTRLPSSPDTQRPRSPLSGRRRRSNEASPSDRPVSDSSAGRRDVFQRALRLENMRSREGPMFPLQLVLETLVDNILLQLT